MEIQTQEILNRLKEAKIKENINECMLLIRAFGQEWQKQLEDSYREEIIALLKEKILEIIVSKGDILDKSILWAYGLFEGRKSSKKDERFMKYFDFCSPMWKIAMLLIMKGYCLLSLQVPLCCLVGTKKDR